MKTTIDNLEIDYTHEPADGDGWHDEHFDECVIIESIIRDGQEIIDEYSDVELDDLAERILAGRNYYVVGV